MNFELTRFIFPLEEPVCYSKYLNLYFDNPRTDKEIEFFKDLLIGSYENEKNLIRLPIESEEDIITLSEIVEIFNKTFSPIDKYCESFSKSYSKDDIFKYIAKMFVIIRFEDEGEYERITQDLNEIRKDGTLALTILEDDHPLIKNSQNLKHYSSLVSLLINTEEKEYLGNHFLLKETFDNIQKMGFCEKLNQNILMWGLSNSQAKHHLEKFGSLENWESGDWRYFPFIKENLFNITSKIDKLFEKGYDKKLIYISRVLFISNELFDERICLLNYVGLIELLVTHNPDFNRYNVEDSISKQFILKTCTLIHLVHPEEDLEKIKNRLKTIYTQRSNIAHGNFQAIEKYEKGLSKKEGKEEYFDDLLTDTLWYLKSILTFCLKDMEFVDFIKKN